MVSLSRDIREALMAVIEKSMTTVFAKMNEQWVTADELCQQFQMFTKDWLEKYGDILPRKQVRVECTVSGEKRGTRWGYAKMEIAENLRNGVYDDLKLLR